MARTPANWPQVDPEEILQGIRRWVEVETPSYDGESVNRLVDLVETEIAGLGAHIERTPGRDGYGDVLIARSPWGGDGPGILVLSHLDTVHPLGTLAEPLSFRRDGDNVYGPGIYDMKGGACLALYAFQHLVRRGHRTPLPITFLFVPEEEIGSPTSRPIIENVALANKLVLVTEPAHDGRCCTARKGVLHLQMAAHGRPAHAGSRHQDGRSAIRELAHHIVEIERLTDYQRGITANVGVMSGGTMINVVPAQADAQVCVRAWETDTLLALRQRIIGRKPVDPEVRLDISGEINRPVFERKPGTERLYLHAKEICRELGFDLQERRSGGGSDGNFTAALDIPTLDGLGVDGKGHHTLDEHLYFSSLEPRARMWIRLFETLR